MVCTPWNDAGFLRLLIATKRGTRIRPALQRARRARPASISLTRVDVRYLVHKTRHRISRGKLWSMVSSRRSVSVTTKTNGSCCSSIHSTCRFCFICFIKRALRFSGRSISCSVCSTFVCPTEITAFSDATSHFKEINCELIACSTDSQYSHLAWIKTPRNVRCYCTYCSTHQ